MSRGWIRFAKDNVRPVISTYIFAMLLENEFWLTSLWLFDMEDMMEPKMIKARLAVSPVMEKHTVEIPKYAEWLSGLRGAQFVARVDVKTQAEIRFDFNSNVGPRAEIFRRLLMEFLNDRGAFIEELNEATLAVEGKHLAQLQTHFIGREPPPHDDVALVAEPNDAECCPPDPPMSSKPRSIPIRVSMPPLRSGTTRRLCN